MKEQKDSLPLKDKTTAEIIQEEKEWREKRGLPEPYFPEKAAKALVEHYKNISPEEFLEEVERITPELLLPEE